MSGESTPVRTIHRSPHRPSGDGFDGSRVLDALSDPDCRAILEAVESGPKTASECAESTGRPTSTTYRKIELLTKAGLLEEDLRLRRDGKHASEYRRGFDDVSVEMDDQGRVEVSVTTLSEGATAEPCRSRWSR